MTNFADILSKPADQIERPKPLPVGSYLGVISGAPKFDNIGKESTPVCDFQVRVVRPMDDVNQDDLAAMGGLTERTQRLRFFLTDAAMYRLKEFLVDHLAIDMPGATLQTLINEAPNKQFILTIKHNPSRDGGTIYTEIDRTAKV